MLMAHDWPGNVRELENAIEHAFVLCRGQRIEPRHLPEPLHGSVSRTADLASAVRVAETEAIIEALRRNHNNRQAAARDLGMHRATFFRKVKELGLVLPETDGRRRARSRKVALTQHNDTIASHKCD